MKLSRSTTRSPEDIASAFGELVEEGRALLAEALDKPDSKTKSTLQDTFDDVSRKLADFQSSATRAAQRGAKYSVAYAKEADRYLHDNPWPIVAAGVVLGALTAIFVMQRR
jgi:ElaB/YqjD/DUF883 family membrane-anchored ribosome-binding protein